MQPKLRAAPPAVPFQLVLVEPEIPQNTGNIARLAAATQCPLHLVGRLGFRIDDRSVRRAGIDYWHLVDLRVHTDFQAFVLRHEREGGGAVRLFSATGARSYLDAPFSPGDALVFGKESSGLSSDILDRYRREVYGIPTIGSVRSLNLASAAAIVTYEALRKTGALANAHVEPSSAGDHQEPDDFVR
jgi:tRNA (cytidine/uridine-2'-O-)-methyltransferase